jgi:hypothetical protein
MDNTQTLHFDLRQMALLKAINVLSNSNDRLEDATRKAAK